MPKTRAPGHDVVLYDGDCGFCTRSSARLKRLLGPAGAGVVYSSFREPGALTGFPGLSPADCETELKYIRADGEFYGGAEAIAQLLRRRPIGCLALAYYIPGLRQLADASYRFVARNRFSISGGACQGSCQVRLQPRSNASGETAPRTSDEL